MLEIALSILIVITTIIAFFAAIKFIRYLLKSNNYINRLLFFAFFGFFFGFAYEFLRIISFIFLGDVNSTVDQFFFSFKIMLIFAAISALLEILFIIDRQGGAPVKHESALRYFYLGMLVFITVFNIYFYEKIPLDSGNIYMFQVHPITLLISLFTYTPMFLFVVLRTIKISRKIDDQKLGKLNLIFGTLICVLTFERCVNITLFLVFPSLIFLLFDVLTIFIILVLVSYYLFFGKIDLLESVSTYFCLKTLYIIKKETGHMFYEHEFRAGASSSALLTDRFLLGGFLYAITQGLELGLGLSGNVDIIQAGKTTILLRHGKFVFGLLFTLEYTQTLEERVRKYMERFEQTYASVLENWTGDLSQIKMEQLNAWTLEIFKKF
jgi:hypothetical protein